MENTDKNNESRITKIFKSIAEAFSFAKENKDKKCKVSCKTGTNDYYVSYILNQTQED